ncbi:MAG: carboxymuconolactone decarboxylase family protein [Anaerolineae bacterium]|nr:carboxymuconolactone decarboxylase family protein [Anaerolineae bacterium]
MTRNQFTKRFYHNPLHVIQDVAYLLTHAPRARALVRGNITPAFRERLMLTVTAVNACRYCAYFHTRLALTLGIERTEIEQILHGVVENAPENERVALAYAQHWAETNAQPDSAARATLVATYGEDTARAIELVLRMIRVGNLLGNTFDYVLYRLSFGRYGAASLQQKIAPHDASA